MTGRFEWERALRDADTDAVPWHVKSMLLLVGTYMSADGADARPLVRTLSRNTGLSARRIYELLRDAEEAGWLRSISTPGKATRRVPAVPDPCGPPQGCDPPQGLSKPTPAAHRRDPCDPPQGTPAAHRTHTTQDKNKTTHLPHRRAEKLIRETCTDATDDEISILINELAKEARKSLPSYVATLARNGDLPDRLEQLRETHQRAGIAAELAAARADPAQRCDHGTDGGRHRRSDTRTLLCAQCRAEDRCAAS